MWPDTARETGIADRPPAGADRASACAYALENEGDPALEGPAAPLWPPCPWAGAGTPPGADAGLTDVVPMESTHLSAGKPHRSRRPAHLSGNPSFTVRVRRLRVRDAVSADVTTSRSMKWFVAYTCRRLRTQLDRGPLPQQSPTIASSPFFPFRSFLRWRAGDPPANDSYTRPRMTDGLRRHYGSAEN